MKAIMYSDEKSASGTPCIFCMYVHMYIARSVNLANQLDHFQCCLCMYVCIIPAKELLVVVSDMSHCSSALPLDHGVSGGTDTVLVRSAS